MRESTEHPRVWVVLVLMLATLITGALAAPPAAAVPAGSATPPVPGCKAVSLTVSPGPITHTATWLTPGDRLWVTATGTVYPGGVNPDGIIRNGSRVYTLQARSGYGDTWSDVGTAGWVANRNSASGPISFRILGTTPDHPGSFWGSFALLYTLCESASMPRSQWVPGRVQALHSSKCLAVRGSVHATGVTQEDCVGPELGGPNVRWTVRPTGNGYAEIVANDNGMCLDVAHASLAHAAAVVQGTCWGGTNQQWSFLPIGDDGYYLVVARHSGKCLDVAHISPSAGARVVQGNCWYGTNQMWRFADW